MSTGKEKEPVIFLISNEPWGDVWFSKQHYANELSISHQVYFINPCSKWRMMNLFSSGLKKQVINKNLVVVTYKNNFPVFFLRPLFRTLNDYCNSRKLIQLITPGSKLICWQFDPYRFIRLFGLKNAKRIYHVVDPYMIVDTDPIIGQKADLIVCVNPNFVKNYEKINPNVIHVPHGLSINELKFDDNKVNVIRQQLGVYILFIGTVNDEVDLELMAQISETFSGYNFILIGPIGIRNKDDCAKFEALTQRANVKYLGTIHATELKNYAAAAGVCVIPYRPGAELRSPLKALNYIAQKKPVITSIENNISALENKCIFKAANKEDFLNLTRKALHGELQVDRQATAEYIDSILYPKLIKTIFSKL